MCDILWYYNDIYNTIVIIWYYSDILWHSMIDDVSALKCPVQGFPLHHNPCSASATCRCHSPSCGRPRDPESHRLSSVMAPGTSTSVSETCDGFLQWICAEWTCFLGDASCKNHGMQQSKMRIWYDIWYDIWYMIYDIWYMIWYDMNQQQWMEILIFT